MKRPLLALAMLSLGACDAMPLAPGNEVAESQSAALLPPGSRPIPFYLEALVNFDTTPAGTAIASGSTVNTAYTSMGVTFSCVACTPNGGNGSALAVANSATNNVVAPTAWPMFDERVGVVQAEFALPRRYVSIEATRVLSPENLGNYSPARPWLAAYDANGVLLMKTYWTQGGAVTQMPLVGDATWPAIIKSVRFSSEFASPGAYGVFDNLRFNSDERPRPRL